MKSALCEQVEENVQQIRSGGKPRQVDLLACLCSESRELRCEVNCRLASAFLDVSDFENASVCIKRAWIISDFSPEILPLFVKIHLARNDITAIKEAYKQRGVKESLSSNVDATLNYFNLWQYAVATHLHRDYYEYDYEVLRCVEKLASPYRMNPPRRKILQGNKIKIAYLVFGVTHINSVLIKNNKIMAKYHDKERFDISFYIPDSIEDVVRAPQGSEHVKDFVSYGCKVHVAPAHLSRKDRLLCIASKIFESETDLLVTSALLADFEHYFIAATRPAPLVAGLLQGPPAQYAAPLLDWVLSWSPHPLMDTPCNGSLVSFEIGLPDRREIRPATRDDFGLPGASRVLMSVGRAEKFQLFEYWIAVLEILQLRQDSYYLVVGAEEMQLPFRDELRKCPEWQRVRMLGWRKDCLNIMCLADLLIDTFPSGGGHVLADAMALSIPFVSFENNYLRNYDQTEWSVVDCFADIPELIIQRNDFERMKETVFRLLDDDGFYRVMSETCWEQVQKRQGNPTKGIRRCEDVYRKLLSVEHW
ncbi:hypothetical protein FY034_15880 [Trichlorobacter lovleyi]|uniref:glycosyltransferase n=1 Tax=Trichlorobacter lovleyi TaxID=313985 RepID=UPI00223F4556|nr:glycosyltransferase [Trichlorobacter lovleyi]QOX80353.1 hypothetical protein FY034_15880 [Trichlorobacter lovleyi]